MSFDHSVVTVEKKVGLESKAGQALLFLGHPISCPEMNR